MTQVKRRQVFVDRNVQGGLMLRVAGYWFFCLISVLMMVMVWTVFTGPRMSGGDLLSTLWTRYAPALVASLLLLPLVVCDAVKFSHRFAGPIVRLRGAFRRIARTGRCDQIQFREGDFWHDLADEFNRAQNRLVADRTAEEDATDVVEIFPVVDEQLEPVEATG
jgi:hypothetical protein